MPINTSHKSSKILHALENLGMISKNPLFTGDEKTVPHVELG